MIAHAYRIARTGIALIPLALFSTESAAHDLTRLPVGDGRLSKEPKVGWIWACHTSPEAGGAHRKGPWFNDDGTYDFTRKATVPGSVRWPHKFKTSVENGRRVFVSNDLPDHPTGSYPIPYNSEAYRYDRNPNSIREQDILLDLPANPQLAERPSCAPGAVGLLLSGVVLFNALDAPGRDAVAHETQDACQGHPQESGVYHYHSVSTCVDKGDKPGEHSPLVGYMLDGFGIYGRHGEGGKVLRSADLDECHGETHEIEWDGRKVVMYHYHATWDFPYTAGCLRGGYRMSDVRKISGPPPQRGGRGGMGSMGPDSGPGQGGTRRGPPDLRAAATKLGISFEALRGALGPPPPDFEAAAARLNISVDTLREALGAP